MLIYQIYQSVPRTAPSLGLLALTQVAEVMLELTFRTQPSAKPIWQPLEPTVGGSNRYGCSDQSLYFLT